MYMRYAADTLILPNSQRNNLEAHGVERGLPSSALQEIEGLMDESSLDEAPAPRDNVPTSPGPSSRDEVPSSPGPSFDSFMSGSFLFRNK